MSLITLAFEYMIISSIFETIREAGIKRTEEINQAKLAMKNWNPLSDEELNKIHNMIGGY